MFKPSQDLVFTTFASIACVLAVSSGPTAPIVDLGYAQYEGHFDVQSNTTGFLGIRYAAPPVGNLRFQPPQPPVPEYGVQPATQNPNTCYQAGIGRNTTTIKSYGLTKRKSTDIAASEDCLFLNVFVPGTIPAEAVTTGGLPVVVWIHGGGYVSGYAALYDGSELVADSLNTMIVVVIQYRLGAFGFLSGNTVKARGALNAGLLDQDFALKWTQEHIGLFGGDKGNVTIWGQSAGGGSVLQHIIANGGNTQPPLFNAAITSSMFLPSQYNYDDPVPQSVYNLVVDNVGCASSADTFTCLQSVDIMTLQAVNRDMAVSAFYGTFIFLPVVDGTFIVERPTITLSNGRVNGQVLLAVATQNEGDFFINPEDPLPITDYIPHVFPNLTSCQIERAASIYEEYGDLFVQASMVMADAILVCPTYYLLTTFAGRAWKGLFAIPPALHGGDVPYYFYNPINPPPYDNIQFITAFSQSFLSLAKSYDVNVKFDPTNITPYWNKYVVNETEMLFNRTETGALDIRPIQTDVSLLSRCLFWSSVTAQTAQ